MNEILDELIKTLREELTQYGELHVLLEQQLELIVSRSAEGLFENLGSINNQIPLVAATRQKRDQLRKELASALGHSSTASFRSLIPHTPPEFQPLLDALINEINDLLMRAQQRLRQNHLLLRKSIDLMQQMISNLFPSAVGKTYNQAGSLKAPDLTQNASLCEILV